MEWFSPLWVPNGKVEQLLKETAHCQRERAVELFDYHTSTIYTLAFQAVCIAQILPQARSLYEFSPLAREAYLAFYSGYRASSIAALIPAIEGSLTRIVSGGGADLSVPDKVDRAVSRAIECAARLHFERMWVPREYLTTEYLLGQDERVFVFETFRRWLHRSFFRRTDEYGGATWLTRLSSTRGWYRRWKVFPHGKPDEESNDMCGRMTLDLSIETINEMYRIIRKIDRPFSERYNVAPTQDIPIVREDAEGTREITFARWGLIQH
jgi:hypothetical protein